MPDWLAIPAGILMLAFIVFAFRQGWKVPPSGKDPSSRNDYTT